jgi:peptidoglycan hydrolase FlgJ
MNGPIVVATSPPTLAVPPTGVAGSANLAATQRHARLVDAAQQFEGMLLEQLLKPMQKSQDTGFGQDPDSDRDGSLDTLSSYGTEAVANSISRSGGLGIARKLVADVDRVDAKTQRSQATPVTQVIQAKKGPLGTKV